MPKVIPTDDGYFFECPGCKDIHYLQVKPQKWVFSGTLDSPSFMPSILAKTVPTEHGREAKICHSFVTDGKIRFLADSTHSLAGQEIDLPDIEVKDG